ncbi:hypothetical protein TeGR_g12332 [Tetraparma gracilis]|uniref:Uncharacterized protein n=1 Tax=Tetraparma gracilis TaxID=2962635 RepID=A0ABQ6MZ33_9STRA|nr:hypothetical protein TeGR_g12332 [Tetraparma gracilis]
MSSDDESYADDDFDLDESLGDDSASASSHQVPPRSLTVSTASRGLPQNSERALSAKSTGSNYSEGGFQDDSGSRRSVSFKKQQQEQKARTNPKPAPSNPSTPGSAAYSEKFDSDAEASASGSYSRPSSQRPPPVLPAQLQALRADVERHAKSPSNRAQLLESLSLLEAALLQQKAAAADTSARRRQSTREKRRRAEARRARHHEELAESKKQAKEATGVLRVKEDECSSLGRELVVVKGLLESEKGSAKREAEAADKQREELGALREERDGLKEKLGGAEGRVREAEARAAELETERAASAKVHAAEVKHLEQQLKISMEQLPERQKEIIAAEESRLSRQEQKLHEDETKLKLNEADLNERNKRGREMIALEAQNLKEKALEEVEIVRRKWKQNVEEIETQHKAVRASFSQDEAALDARTRRLETDMIVLREAEKKLAEERMRIEVERSMWKPAMHELEEKRAEAERVQEEVARAGKEIEGLSAKMKRQEMELESKEKDLEHRKYNAEEKERRVVLVEKEQTRQAGNLGRQLTELQEARMGVHQQQIEIAGQVAEVKRVLGAVRMLEGRAGLREGVVTRHDAENVPAPPERVSLKAVEALEAAVDRASRNLQELALRSRQTMGEVRVPVNRVADVAAGVEMGEEAAEREKMRAIVTRPAAVAWDEGGGTGTGGARSVMQILGGGRGVEFSKEAEGIAHQMRGMLLR